MPRVSDADLEPIAQRPPGGRWVLLEAPLFSDTSTASAAAEVRARGMGTLIGHPEHCRAGGGPEALYGELRTGAVLQSNGSSLTGYHGAPTRAHAPELVRSGRAR